MTQPRRRKRSKENETRFNSCRMTPTIHNAAFAHAFLFYSLPFFLLSAITRLLPFLATLLVLDKKRYKPTLISSRTLLSISYRRGARRCIHHVIAGWHVAIVDRYRIRNADGDRQRGEGYMIDTTGALPDTEAGFRKHWGTVSAPRKGVGKESGNNGISG